MVQGRERDEGGETRERMDRGEGTEEEGKSRPTVIFLKVGAYAFFCVAIFLCWSVIAISVFVTSGIAVVTEADIMKITSLPCHAFFNCTYCREVIFILFMQ